MNNYESELVCDLAEYYHIFDYRVLPAIFIATLAAGLRDDARVIMALNSQDMNSTHLLLSGILDRLSLLVYVNTEDCAKGRNYPRLILSGNVDRGEGFDSPDDYYSLRSKILKDLSGGGSDGD